jgi:hypothetical protein
MNGDVRASVPYALDVDTYPLIEASNLRTSNNFAIWFHPDYRHNEKADWKLPVHVVWISKDNQALQTRDLAFLRDAPGRGSLMDQAVLSFAPPAFQFIDQSTKKVASWLGLVPSLVCLYFTWTLLRRHRFSTGAKIAWMLFIVLLGVPGFLAFLSAQEWPKRETCPNCGNLRVVDHEHCEHCAAGFPPPDKIGIEIFEPLAAPKA